MLLEKLHAELGAIDELGATTMRAEQADAVTEVVDVVHDSRKASPHSLFCAVPGLTVDGHDYIDAAHKRGAVAALVEHFAEVDTPQIRVGNVRQAMAHAAALVHGRPSAELAVFGITGTNGKTTTTKLLASILASAGRSCHVIGTLAGAHTTPESTDLQRQLRAAVTAGHDVVALEVSSHALDQCRADATEFAVAAFSNLTPDHLDYHHDMASYFEAKARLFDGRARSEIINIDDPWGTRLAARRPGALAVSLHDIQIVNETIAGTEFNWRGHVARVPLPGHMNVANALMACEAALLLGLDESEIAVGLQSAEPVSGRMQLVQAPTTELPTVVVDYSHTPDSIERALQTLRSVERGGQLSIVFGCGGDRDRSKRPLMAAAAEAGADRVYLTSDNPRSEDPLAIIADALVGFDASGNVVIEPDRREAIRRAIIDAGPGDAILIAGKGHEKTQTVGDDVLPFDDVLVAQEMLEVTR